MFPCCHLFLWILSRRFIWPLGYESLMHMIFYLILFIYGCIYLVVYDELRICGNVCYYFLACVSYLFAFVPFHISDENYYFHLPFTLPSCCFISNLEFFLFFLAVPFFFHQDCSFCISIHLMLQFDLCLFFRSSETLYRF